MKTHFCENGIFLSAVTVALLSLFPLMALSQATTITSPVTGQSYKLPDAAMIQTSDGLQDAIGSAEYAARALNQDVAKEETAATTEQSNLTKAQASESAYITAMNAFNKNDVLPYKADLDNYSQSGTKFNALLTSHNKAVLANNALAAKDRKASTVSALNKEKTQIDTWAAQLSKWKEKLDAAKAKLDIKNAALQKQQQQYQAIELASTTKLKASKLKLKSVADQLTVCSNYSDKCRALLVSKFKVGAGADTGYFNSPAFKSSVTGLSSYLEKLKTF